MNPSPATTQESELTRHTAGKSVSDLIADWTPGVVFDAHQVLAEHPELKDDQSVILDLAYEEYCQRTELGEDIDPSDFVNRFSTVESSLLDMIEVHQVLYDHPSTLANGDSPRWPEVGDSHLDLKLLEKIGSGSFSQVFIASESGVGERRVVAKLCSNANHEASLLGRLEHPNIVPILSVKTDRQKNLSAICMPYMGRTTLAHAIEHFRGRNVQATTPADLVGMLSDRETEAFKTPSQESGFSRRSQLQDTMIDISIQMCRGLEFAHLRGVIHGDLKPSNILLTKQGTALLMDFNLSQHLQPESQAIGGTLAYMAPEQLEILSRSRGVEQRPVACNEQTDVYSLGVMLVELFTGSHPFRCTPQTGSPAESAKSLYEQQQAKAITSRDLSLTIEASLAKIIEKSLAFDPQRRWASVQELRTALEQTISRKNLALRWLRRRRKQVMVACVGLSFTITAASLLYASLPSQSERLVISAQQAWDAGLLSEAVSDLESASALEAQAFGKPTPETTTLLGQARFAFGKNLLQELHPKEAVTQLKLAKEFRPQSPDVLLALSRALIADEQYDEAIRVVEDWRSLDEEDARAVANLAYCYFKRAEDEHSNHERTQEDYGQALNKFENALDLEGNVFGEALLYNIGLCYCKTHEPVKALVPLESAMNNSSAFLTTTDRRAPYLIYFTARLEADYRYSRGKQEQDLSWVETRVAEAPASAELFVAAAHWCAMASGFNVVDQAQNQECLEKCIHYCQCAAALGITVAELNSILRYNSNLNNHAEWQSLTTLTREQSQPKRESTLIDPLL